MHNVLEELNWCFLLQCYSDGVTGLSMDTFKENWSSDYQMTNSAGIPDPQGNVYWNFK